MGSYISSLILQFLIRKPVEKQQFLIRKRHEAKAVLFAALLNSTASSAFPIAPPSSSATPLQPMVLYHSPAVPLRPPGRPGSRPLPSIPDTKCSFLIRKLDDAPANHYAAFVATVASFTHPSASPVSLARPLHPVVLYASSARPLQPPRITVTSC